MDVSEHYGLSIVDIWEWVAAFFRASYHFACQEGMWRDNCMLIHVENQPTLLV